MKIGKKLAVILAAASFVVACSKAEPVPDPKPEPTPEELVFTVSGGSAEVPASGGQIEIKVEYSEAYTVGELPSWISGGTKATKTVTVTDCYLCGKVGTKDDGSDLAAATADNYLDPGIGITIASDANCPSWNATNVHFYRLR